MREEFIVSIKKIEILIEKPEPTDKATQKLILGRMKVLAEERFNAGEIETGTKDFYRQARKHLQMHNYLDFKSVVTHFTSLEKLNTRFQYWHSASVAVALMFIIVGYAFTNARSAE